MTTAKRIGRCRRAAACIILIATAAAALAAEPQLANGKLDALDYAWRFASAIDPDPKDKAMAQQRVVKQLADLGRFDEAAALVAEIEGWRRGVALADLATLMAEAGKTVQASEVLSRARAARSGVQGWQSDRIDAHIAQAYAALGAQSETKEIAKRLGAQERQYGGRAVATIAAAEAAKGNFDGAVETLAQLDEATDLYDAWWRTVGFIKLARSEPFSREQRLAALDRAAESAKNIAGWKRADALRAVGEEYGRLGRGKLAREHLAQAEKIIVGVPETSPVKGAMLSNIARSWAEAGEKQRARDLLTEAREAASGAAAIEQPAVYANIASSYGALGDGDEALAVYGQALDIAQGLVNARPRALALSEIARAMGREGIEPDRSLRQRLDALLGGLKAPW
jgi:tetratricopeptide (TPR) repeat protein